MNPINAILVATDFSAAANAAVRRAALLAQEHEAKLRLLHVVEGGGVYRAVKGLRLDHFDPSLNAALASADLSLFAGELARTLDVVVDVVVKRGDPLDILKHESRRVDLVVLGQSVGGSVKRLVQGSLADRLLSACACPVLVVKQKAEASYRRVLTAFNFTPASDAAALAGATLAPSAEKHFTHVLLPKNGGAGHRLRVSAHVLRRLRSRKEAGAVARMRRRVATMGFDSREVHFAVSRGSSASSILLQQQRHGADLIAVGRQRRSNWLDALMRSVSRRVLARSQGDVLLVPTVSGSPVRTRAVAALRLAVDQVNSVVSAAGVHSMWTHRPGPPMGARQAMQQGSLPGAAMQSVVIPDELALRRRLAVDPASAHIAPLFDQHKRRQTWKTRSKD